MNNLNLLDIRRPGVTTFELDNTATDRVVDDVIFEERLIVGFSRKGAFNTVTRITSVEDRRRVYGEIDEFLEKRGSYFHRMIDIALQEGPVLALNLLPVNNSEDGGDYIDYTSFSVSPQNTNSGVIKDLYSKFYEKERFWKPSTSNFLQIINSNTLTRNSILSFVNLGQDKYSILIKKTDSVVPFDRYIQEYYSTSQEVPSYLNPLDKLSDYFVDVIVLKGDFTNYQKLSTDPTYSKYFDSNGLKASALTSIRTSKDFNVVLSVTGSLIPDLLDGSGISYSIDTLINSYISNLGLLCVINDDYLNSLSSEDLSVFDLTGHSLTNQDVTSVDYLSYKFNLLENLEYTRRTTHTSVNYTLAETDYQNSIGNNDYGLFLNRIKYQGTSIQANLIPNVSLVELNNDDYGVIKSYITSSGNTIVNYTHPDKRSEGTFFYYIDSVSSNSIIIEGEHPDFENMETFSIYVTDGNLKYYFEVEDYSIDTSNSLTTIDLVADEDIDILNTNFRVTWGAGYKINRVVDDVININGVWDNLEFITSSNVLYLKTNSGITGELEYSSFVVGDSTTDITLSSATLNGVDLLGTDTLIELVNNATYVSFGSDGIRRPKKVDTVKNVIVPSPDKVIIENDSLYAYRGSQIYSDWLSGVLTSQDIYYKEVTSPITSIIPYYISIVKTTDKSNIDVLKINLYTDINLTALAEDELSFGNKKKGLDGSYENVGSNQIAFSSKIGNINKKYLITSTYDNNTRVRLSSTIGEDLKVGDMINTIEGEQTYLSPILTKKRIVIGNDVFYDITMVRPANVFFEGGEYYIERYLKINSFTPNYNLIGLSGFKLTDYHLPGDFITKDSQLRKILGVLENTNLVETLTDKNYIDFYYIVDTFDSLITNELEPKNILSRLAKKQGRSVAIINAPSIKMLSESQVPAPIFTSLENNLRVFDAKYILTGGNLDVSSDYVMSLPSEENGSKYTCVVTPYFRYLKPNGQSMMLPPSAHASNIYVRRNNSSNPYRIGAGVDWGFVGDSRILGVEIFNEPDLDYLDPVGYNTFINKRGYGIVLYGNNTAYQTTLSSLNKLHVRDMLNKIERDIELILTKYVFGNNTPRTRYLVYEDVNTLLRGLRGSAFYDYTVKIDSENNTAELINRNFGVVEITIYPISGIEKFINILTIDKVSGVQSSGFRI